MKLAFTKMQGCGNDFVVCQALTRPVTLPPERIAGLAHRRFGIGFDQWLMIEPPLRPSSDFGLSIFNSDGSAAAHCGNGARCAARFVLDNKLTHKPHLTWDLVTGSADAGTFTTTQCSAHMFRVEMGVPRFDAERIPLQQTAGVTRIGEHQWSITIEDEDIAFTAVNLGNPHAVIMVENLASAPVATRGEALAYHPAFPEGVNVGFCQWLGQDRLGLRVHERGVGETLACGSGACAAAVAAGLLGRVGSHVVLNLPGGTLEVGWPGPGHSISLTGPTEVSFRGQLML